MESFKSTNLLFSTRGVEPVKTKQRDSWSSHLRVHGPLTELRKDRLWMSIGTFGPREKEEKRNMVVYKMENGELMVHSPIVLDEDSMQKLNSMGLVRLVIVPNLQHNIDSGVWRDRYPDATFVCPSVHKEQLQQKEEIRIDGIAEDLSQCDLGISVHTIDGMKKNGGFGVGGELCFQVKLNNTDTALIFTDALFNEIENTGIKKFLLGNSFEVSRLIKLIGVEDQQVLSSWLRKMASDQSIKIIALSHGAPILDNASSALLDAASKLQ